MNILNTVKKRKINWIGQTLRRNCLLKRVIERKIVKGIRLSVRKQLMDELKGKRCSWVLKQEALDHTLWRTRI